VFETVARLAFFGAIVVALYHLMQHVATHHMSHALVLGTFGCLVSVAFLKEFVDIKTYALLGRKYGRMNDLYGNADKRLGKLLTMNTVSGYEPDRSREVLFELGCEALAENADWVIQHRQRPPTLPSG
jgi:hypothetical protein